METGSFNFNDYLEKLHEQAEANTQKGFTVGSAQDGILMPDDGATKKSFDWLKSEYQKGKTEVKVEIKGEGSSFKPGYDLQTDLKSVKDFKPGMFGDVKTSDNETPEPKSPKNKKEETPAEKKEETSEKVEVQASEKTPKKDPKSQQMKIDVKSKNKNDQ